MDRSTVKPKRTPSIVKLACLMFALAVSFVWAASQLSRCTQSQGATMQPNPYIISEHDRWLRTVNELIEIGRVIPPNSPVQRLAARRHYAADKLADIATFLFYNDLEPFADVIAAACDGLREQWPDLAEFCEPCRQ